MSQVVVGRVGRPHGIRGESTVEVRTDDPDERFAVGASLATEPAGRGPLTVDAARWAGGTLLLRFAGVADRDGAERLRDTLLLVDTDELPELTDQDEYYDHQLVGLTVRDIAARSGGLPVTYGTVGDVLHAPASPVLVVDRPGGGQTLVPFVAAIVPAVDLAGGYLTVDPPDGLFD